MSPAVRIAALAIVIGTTALVAAHAADPSDPAAAKSPAAKTADAADRSPRRRERRRANRDEAATEAAAEAAADTPVAASSVLENAVMPTAESVAEDAAGQVVCRSMKVIGSRIERRICRTAGEWAADQVASEATAQEEMRQLRTRSGLVSPPDPRAPQSLQ